MNVIINETLTPRASNQSQKAYPATGNSISGRSFLPKTAMIDRPTAPIKRSRTWKLKWENKACMRMASSFISYSFFILILSQGLCFAKDYGVHGHLFEIVEPDLLKEITGKLNELGESGKIDKHNDVLKKRVAHSIRNPRPVEGLKRARENRSFAYDPSIEVPYDLKDQKGQVFHKAGTRVNPLDYKPLSKPLVFIDGSDQAQIDWALESYDIKDISLILTNGSPFDLMEAINHPVFFDQHGRLTKKFGIEAMPATVKQSGRFLLVTEVVL